MRLIYINEIGADYKGQKQYEFIFSSCETLDYDEWFIVPAASITEGKTPDIEDIDTVALLKDSDLDLELIQNSDYFGIIDAVDGVISLGWEKFDLNLDVSRIFFKFGEKLENVERKLTKRGFELIKTNIKED
jgi:hypothetical protein